MPDQYWDLEILESDFLCRFGWSAISMVWGALQCLGGWHVSKRHPHEYQEPTGLKQKEQCYSSLVSFLGLY